MRRKNGMTGLNLASITILNPSSFIPLSIDLKRSLFRNYLFTKFLAKYLETKKAQPAPIVDPIETITSPFQKPNKAPAVNVRGEPGNIIIVLTM